MAMTSAKLGKGSMSARYIQIKFSVMDSLAFKSLSPAGVKLWLDLMRQYNGHNNGKIASIYSQMEAFGWAETTMHRALKELRDKGFIVKTQQGTLRQGGGLPTFYRFTHLETDDIDGICRPSRATHEYREWRPK